MRLTSEKVKGSTPAVKSPAFAFSATAPTSQTVRWEAPTLRLVTEQPEEAGKATYRNADGDGPPDGHGPRILIVAHETEERTRVRRELAAALNSGGRALQTSFSEAGNIWEVLQQAPQCGVVMVAGALADISARTLIELLGRRHPWLPIVVLDPPDAEAQTDPVSV